MAAKTDSSKTTVRAQAKWVRMSARKARLVLDLLRGRTVPEARTILAFTPRAAAREIDRVLASAVANAESAHGLDGDELVILEAYADEGPTLKRWRARARGRVNRIRKRTCHITIVVRREPQGGRPRPQNATKPAAGDRADDSRHTRRRGGPGEEKPKAKRRTPAKKKEGGRLMGQKVHPGGLRVGVIHDWKSNWWTGKKEIADYILEDIRIRDHINGKLAHAGLSDILIRKDKQRITVDIYTARPGIVIGKSGVEVDALRKELHAITGKSVHININEIKRPELDAQLVAQSIAEQLQNRVSFRRAMKRSLASAMRSGAQGIKIQCGGRLGGGEMSRSERYTEGRVPLHTIRADIDYGFAEAKTTYGRIGVKVWVNKGEIMPEGYEGSLGRERITEADGSRRRRGSNTEGLGASRESARGRGQDREGLGLVQKRRRPGGRGRGGQGGQGQGRGPARERGATPETQAPPSDQAPETQVESTPPTTTEATSPPSETGGDALMLMPRKTKHRKQFRGRRAGYAKGQLDVQFGDFGIKALENGWVTNRQIEAARIAMTRKIKRGGKVWINVFPDKPFTKKPAETRMGSGKGSPEGWVAVVKPGRVMFELSGVDEPLAKEALRLAAQKLPMKTKFVKREADLFES